MRNDLLALVDHTALKPETTAGDVDRLCDEAIEWGVAAVCVNGTWIGRVSTRLDGSGVATCSVVGFPLGAMAPDAMAREAALALEHGAREIDMVIPIGPAIAGDAGAVARAVSAVRAVPDLPVLKVILETGALTDEQITTVGGIAVQEGADFLKTSTGFHASGGATLAAVRLLRSAAGPDLGVKASGGIRSVADADAMVAAGANRLGMSATASLAAAE